MASPAPETTPTPLREVLPATASSLPQARRSLRLWLGDLQLNLDDLADLMLAVHEAVENVVEHAYTAHDEPGEITLEAAVVRGRNSAARVLTRVTDSGRWKPTPRDQGYRGRGLQIMRSCADSLDITCTEAGTCVTLISRPF
jgi:anti-sigma regulatory factor (Ser/Thr protein kinase)